MYVFLYSCHKLIKKKSNHLKAEISFYKCKQKINNCCQLNKGCVNDK